MVHWYVARLLMRYEVGEHDPGPWTCDEQVRLIRCSDAERAFEKAVALGRGEEDSYKNEFGEDVRWMFVGLVELEDLDVDEIAEGSEITSRLFKSKNPDELVRPRERLNALWPQYNPWVSQCTPRDPDIQP